MNTNPNNDTATTTLLAPSDDSFHWVWITAYDRRDHYTNLAAVAVIGQAAAGVSLGERRMVAGGQYWYRTGAGVNCWRRAQSIVLQAYKPQRQTAAPLPHGVTCLVQAVHGTSSLTQADAIDEGEAAIWPLQAGNELRLQLRYNDDGLLQSALWLQNCPELPAPVVYPNRSERGPSMATLTKRCDLVWHADGHTSDLVAQQESSERTSRTSWYQHQHATAHIVGCEPSNTASDE